MCDEERQSDEEVLGSIALPEFAEPEPGCERMLAGAYERAQSGEQQLGAVTSRRPGPRALLGVTLAAAALALVLAVVLWPSAKPDREPPGGAAWAMTEGYIIDFDLLQVVPPEDLGIPATSAEEWLLLLTDEEVAARGLGAYPQLVFLRALAKWTAEHVAPDGAPLIKTREPPGQHGWLVDEKYLVTGVSLALLADDDELLADLLAMLEGLPGVSPSRAYRETLYLSEKFPEIYAPGRKVIVDGREHRFPDGVDGQYVTRLHTMFSVFDHDRVYYRAYWTTLSSKTGGGPLVSGDVLKIRFNESGDMIIDTLVEHWETEGERKSVSLAVDPAELPADFDVLAELARRLARKQEGGAVAGPERHRFRLDLIPFERLRAGGAEKITAEELAQSREAYERIRGAFAVWYDEHPELESEYYSERRARLYRPHYTFGDGVVRVSGRLDTDDAALIDGLERVLAQAAGVDVSWVEDD